MEKRTRSRHAEWISIFIVLCVYAAARLLAMRLLDPCSQFLLGERNFGGVLASQASIVCLELGMGTDGLMDGDQKSFEKQITCASVI